MHEENAEKKKAARDLRVLLTCVILGVAIPLVLFFATHVRSTP
jgi:hypothetical protein